MQGERGDQEGLELAQSHRTDAERYREAKPASGWCFRKLPAAAKDRSVSKQTTEPHRHAPQTCPNSPLRWAQSRACSSILPPPKEVGSLSLNLERQGLPRARPSLPPIPCKLIDKFPRGWLFVLLSCSASSHPMGVEPTASEPAFSLKPSITPMSTGPTSDPSAWHSPCIQSGLPPSFPLLPSVTTQPTHLAYLLQLGFSWTRWSPYLCNSLIAKEQHPASGCTFFQGTRACMSVPASA